MQRNLERRLSKAESKVVNAACCRRCGGAGMGASVVIDERAGAERAIPQAHAPGGGCPECGLISSLRRIVLRSRRQVGGAIGPRGR